MPFTQVDWTIIERLSKPLVTRDQPAHTGQNQCQISQSHELDAMKMEK